MHAISENQSNLYEIQLSLEAEMQGAGILRFHKQQERAINSGTASNTDYFRRLTREFVRPMADAIKAYLEYYSNRRGKPSANLMHLKCLSPEAASFIAIKCIFDALMNHKITAQKLASTIGKRIEDEIRFTKLSTAAPEYIKAIKESLKKRSSQSYQYEHDVFVHTEKELKTLSDFQKLHAAGDDKLTIQRLMLLDDEQYYHYLGKIDFVVEIERWIPFSENDTIQLGSKLIEIFSNNMTLNGEPLIAREERIENMSTKLRIVPTKALESWIQEYIQVVSEMQPAYAPCVVPPKKWTSPFNGGFHSPEVSSRLPIAKVKNRKHLRTLTRAKMPKVYDALNAAQETAWEVHPFIVSIADQIRTRKLPLAMPEWEQVPEPVCPVPSIYSELRGEELLAMLNEEQRADFKQWKRSMAAYYSLENKRKADVREAHATIDQALKYSKYNEIYFVYSMDFRSRVYCMSNLLYPQGNDLQKALIRFKEKVRFGAYGEYWFKVHGANIWGWDKDSFAERVNKVSDEDFQEMCRDIAADPMTFTDWIKADKPWQFLAWCFEYNAFLEHLDDGLPAEDFESHVSVAMDGSCSGTQHYSAMLRDTRGGSEVNLTPSDKPKDIYKAVSDVVVEWMEAILEGKPEDCKVYDKVLSSLEKSLTKQGYEGDIPKQARVLSYQITEEWMRIGVNRSMTKISVMTLPYGSSQLTCRAAINDYLADLQAKADRKARGEGKTCTPIHNFTDLKGSMPREMAISFASSLVWAAIGEVVVAAREAMRYIKNIANIVAKANKPLIHTTPTGFTVYQEIFEVKEDKRVKTQLMGETKFVLYEETSTIDVTRMKSSAAPNFVHSMDASHLIFTVSAMKDKGINSIAVIHDSFGTHAGNVPLMRQILLSEFVNMYENFDVIKSYKEENEDTNQLEIDVELPEYGSLDLKEVLLSDYCFS